MVKRCLVLGSAKCMQYDIDRALSMAEFDGVVAAKGAGLFYPGPLLGWVSLHPDRMQRARDERAAKGYPTAEVHFGHQFKSDCSGIDVWYDYKFEGQTRSASSGIFAVRVALDYFHFDQVVMCGVPMLKDQGRLDDNRDTWQGENAFKQGFLQAIPAFKDRVRSMGGWTATQVGLPTADWLNGR